MSQQAIIASFQSQRQSGGHGEPGAAVTERRGLNAARQARFSWERVGGGRLCPLGEDRKTNTGELESRRGNEIKAVVKGGRQQMVGWSFKAVVFHPDSQSKNYSVRSPFSPPVFSS